MRWLSVLRHRDLGLQLLDRSERPLDAGPLSELLSPTGNVAVFHKGGTGEDEIDDLHPGQQGHVGDRIARAGDEGALGEALVDNLEQVANHGAKARARICSFGFWRVVGEMYALAEGGTDIGDLHRQPLHRLTTFRGVGSQKLSRLLGEIEEDCA